MHLSGVGEAARGGELRQYRLYFFDGATRVASAPYEFEAVDDDAAMRVAEAWREGRVMELWNHDRKVRCWGFPTCSNPNCR